MCGRRGLGLVIAAAELFEALLVQVLAERPEDEGLLFLGVLQYRLLQFLEPGRELRVVGVLSKRAPSTAPRSTAVSSIRRSCPSDAHSQPNRLAGR
jgi:hypothetical protein